MVRVIGLIETVSVGVSASQEGVRRTGRDEGVAAPGGCTTPTSDGTRPLGVMCVDIFFFFFSENPSSGKIIVGECFGDFPTTNVLGSLYHGPPTSGSH